ncbi:MAG: InlB B-repeat-containing protein, partial [Clostridia bacterium]|nr:InlB B-repeat-containing protein [Clostridia bacterium]
VLQYEGAEVITLGISNGQYSLKDSNGKYLYSPADGNNLETRTNAFYWNVTIEGDFADITYTSESTTYQIMFNSNSGSQRFSCYKGTMQDICIYVSTLVLESELPELNTVTFNSMGGSEVSSQNVYTGDVATAPNKHGRTGYEFGGWFTDEACTESYSFTTAVNGDITLYAKWTEVTSEPEEEDKTVTINIADYATANSWADATKYSTISKDETTITAEGGGNTGKYYNNGTNWRIYQNESPTVTISVADGYVIKSVIITYTVSNTGVLTQGETQISSGSTVEVNANSITFSVGNTGSATNGQVRITEIEVVYGIGGTEPEHTHNATLVAGQDATCCTPGYNSCYYCEGCETYFTDSECTEANIIGGEADYVEWKNTTGKGMIEATNEHTYNYAENGCVAHTCVSVCTTCNKCLDASCKEYNHDSKCEGHASEPEGTTITLSVPEGVDAVEMGDGNVLPSAGAPDGYTFVGWSESTVDETTTEPTIYKVDDEYTGTATTLYAVYTRNETTPGSSSFVKVTSAPTDWSGDYLIVYEAGNVAFNGGLTTLDAASNNISVTITDGKIEANGTTNAAMFTIAKSGTSYTIKSASGYYIGNTADSNKLNSSQSTQYTNTISLNDDGSVQIVGSGNSVLRYNANSGNYRFRYFKSSTYTGQKAICLYKLTETSTTYYTTDITN